MDIGEIMILAQKVSLYNKPYLLLPGGSIVSPDWKGEIGFAHLNDDGTIMRYGVQIGHISDLDLDNMVSLEVSCDLLAGILDTIMEGTITTHAISGRK